MLGEANLVPDEICTESLEGTTTVIMPMELAAHVSALQNVSLTSLKLSTAHVVQTEAPVEAMYVCAGQGTADDRPVDGQWLQVEQLAGTDSPVVEQYVPIGQARHMELLVAPTVAE